MNKDFLYIGHYYDTDGNYVLKVGTTNDLERRKREHTRAYKKSPTHTLAQSDNFEYDWTLPLSHLNTLRYEEKAKENLKNCGGEYIRNDRFVYPTKPQSITVEIKKTYTVNL